MFELYVKKDSRYYQTVIKATSAMNAHRLLCMQDDKPEPEEEILQSFELGDWHVVRAKANGADWIGMEDQYGDWKEGDIGDWIDWDIYSEDRILRSSDGELVAAIVGHSPLADLKRQVLVVPADE